MIYLLQSIDDNIPYCHAYTTKSKLDTGICLLLASHQGEEDEFDLIQWSNGTLIFEYNGFLNRIRRTYAIRQIDVD